MTFLPVQEERTENKLYGKLTWDPSVSDRLNLVLGYDDLADRQSQPRQLHRPGGRREPGVAGVLLQRQLGAHAVRRGLHGAQALGLVRARTKRNPKNGDLPSVQILGGNREIFRNAIYTRKQEPENLGFDANFDWFVTTGSVNHSFKIGGEYEVGTWLENRTRNGNMTWRPEEGDGPFDPDDPSTWGFISSDWGSGIRLDGESVNAAIYVQDYIDLTPSLRLSAGLRYGIWEGDLTPGFGEGGSFEAVSDSAVEPRLGLVWDLTGEAKWIAKAHWGRYHQSIFALLYDRVIGGDVFQDTEYWDWIGPGLPDVNRIYTEAERETFFEFYDDARASSEVGPALDYEQPYVDQLVVGLEHAVGRRWRVGVNYINRKNKAIVALEDRNLATNYTVFNNVEVIDWVGRTSPCWTATAIR